MKRFKGKRGEMNLTSGFVSGTVGRVLSNFGVVWKPFGVFLVQELAVCQLFVKLICKSTNS